MNKSIESEVISRVDCLLNDPQLLEIHKEFGGLVFRRSSVLNWFEKFLIRSGALENAHLHKNCVEIGTRHGLTAVVLARYFDNVYTFDIKPSDFKHKIIKHFGIKNIHFYDIPGNTKKYRIIDGLDFQYAYLDGDHAADSDADFEAVKHCNHVIFDEAETSNAVRKVLGKLKRKNIYKRKNFAYWVGVDN